MKILLVDDSEGIAEVFQMLLTKAISGAEVNIANNGFLALEMIKNKSFDILITDLNMPMMTGMQLVSNVRVFSNMPIILFSSNADEVEGHVLKSLRITKAIHKPCSAKDLASEIMNAIQKK